MVAAGQHTNDFKTQGLVNIAWAFAKMGQSDTQLFTSLARRPEADIDNFNTQELANTAWAVATLGLSVVQLFLVFAKVSGQHAGYC